MRNLATEKLFNAVNESRQRADRAEAEFERKEAEIQEDAGQSIDLFGGNAVSRVADIASASRMICDSLYAAYQTEVQLLDEACRPYLDQNPSAQAVREVTKLIRWLNKESEIEGNFTASFNSHDLGDVASVRYIPSMENKMIQRYWENKYEAMPGGENLEYTERRAVEQRQLTTAERRRADAEKRRKAFADAQNKIKAEEAEYQAARRKWQGEKAQAEQKRFQRLQQRLDEERSRLEIDIHRKYNKLKKEYTACIDALEKQKAQLQKQLEATGAFQFSEKHALKKQIRELTQKIAEQDKLLTKATEAFEVDTKAVSEAVDGSRDKIRKEVDHQIPLPKEPTSPDSLSKKQSGPQLDQERREFLLNLIRRRNPCTQSYIEKETEMYFTRDGLRIYLEQLHNEGLITRYVDGNYCYEIY